jgi:hypothetical protein
MQSVALWSHYNVTQNFWHHLRSKKRNISINIDLDMFRFDDTNGKMCVQCLGSSKLST